jgi:hypothetical protein
MRKVLLHSKKAPGCMAGASLKDSVLPARLAPPVPTTARAAGPVAATAATVTSATSPVAAPSGTVTAAARTRLTRPGFVHGESSAADIGPVERFDCFVRFGRVYHFHKRKSTGLSRIPILHNLNPVNLPVGRKRGIEILLSRLERDVPDIYILQVVLLKLLLRLKHEAG